MTYIIAEAGVNHNGSLLTAKELVLKAKEAGADCIKFQTFNASSLVSKKAKKAEYQNKNTGSSESQYEMLKKLELSPDDFFILKDFCVENKIDFMSTAFDFDSIELLHKIGQNIWKIPSGEINNLPYLIKIGQKKKKVILSTGMSTLLEIQKAIEILNKEETFDITLLHCTTEYPAPFQEVNLRAMKLLRNEFGLPVGYSDHTKGIEISLAAVALGAEVIEKHFTLDKNMEGPDHKASIDFYELKQMVDSIRHIELALGTEKKEPSESEIKNIAVARKSIVAKRKIKKGEIFTEENISVKRPGTGISPMEWFNILGKISPKEFEEDELISL